MTSISHALKKNATVAFLSLFAFIEFMSATEATQSSLWLEVDKDGLGYVRQCAKSAKGAVVIPDSFSKENKTYKVKRIGTEAFKDCNQITRITIPATVSTIQKGAFKNCTSLDSVVIPSSVTKMERSIFWGCHNLSHVAIPVSVTTISTYTFVDCKSLKSIKLPASVKEIGKECFSGSAIEEFALPPFVDFLGEGAFKDCKQLKSIALNNKITLIRKETFMGCYSLKSITIPDGITAIGTRAFTDCIGLSEIDLKNAVLSTSMDAQEQATFKGCTNLKTVKFGTNVKFIPPFTFENCRNLQTIELPEELIGLYVSAFDGTLINELRIPAKTTQIAGLETKSQINSFKVSEDNQTYIDDNGVLFSKDMSRLIRYPATKADVEYHIPESVKSISDNAFKGNGHLKIVFLPKNIDSIGKNVFEECSASVK